MKHTCKHCGEEFEREKKRGTPPTACDECNPRRRYPHSQPENRARYNADYRARRAA